MEKNKIDALGFTTISHKMISRVSRVVSLQLNYFILEAVNASQKHLHSNQGRESVPILASFIITIAVLHNNL